MKKQEKQIIGSTEYVTIAGKYFNVPAKIDTGADSSAIWVSDISVDEAGVLSFKLFDKKSPFYTGETETKTSYKAVAIRSSNGQTEVRYRTKFDLELAGRKIRATFSLADRGRNHFPILIGRRTLNHKFLVDVSESAVPRPKKPKSESLNHELQNDPYKFHQKYQLGKEN